MSLRTSDYDYPLPEELIARYPLPDRAASHMMVVHRDSGQIEHRHFSDFPGYVRDGDLVVLNDTRVIPARVFSDDGRIELLFLEPAGETTWRCLVKPGRRMRIGAQVAVLGNTGVVREIRQPDGDRVIEFGRAVDLERAGKLPLPPYLERQAEDSDAKRYQTVYAREPGAVAAPTAGLHFTPGGVGRVSPAFLTPPVGVGAFCPVQAGGL